MKPLLLALLLALGLGALTEWTVPRLYAAGLLTVEVSDGEGHGPDPDGPEWRHAAARAVPRRCDTAATLVGLTGFAAVVLLWRQPPRPQPRP